MLGWLRRLIDSLALESPSPNEDIQTQSPQSIPNSSPNQPNRLENDDELYEGVESFVELVHNDSQIQDDDVIAHLVENGFTEQRAIKLIQFVPIAFTRFLYRTNPLFVFPSNLIVMNSSGQAVADRRLMDEPAFREAWRYCEKSTASKDVKTLVTPIAARSGGYKSIQEVLDNATQEDLDHNIGFINLGLHQNLWVHG